MIQRACLRFLFCGIAAVILQLQANSVLAEDNQAESNKIKSWYIGAGLGVSMLDPDVAGTGYSLTDDRDTGFKIFAGADLSQRLSVEAFYADLGSAQLGDHVIKPDVSVDYSTLGLSALWYVWQSGESLADNKTDNQDGTSRKGLQFFIHGGLSFLDNSSTVKFNQDNNVQVQYGAGLEYGFTGGYALRAAVDLYDKDASMVYVGIMKRFGVKAASPVVVTQTDKETVEPAVDLVIPEVVISYDTDSDQDGVFDRIDQCADSPSGIKVDANGCSVFIAELLGVNFEKNAYSLTEASKGILNDAVILINSNPKLKKIEVQAYTDSLGSEKYNLELSEKRAAVVMDYLISHGVDPSRLTSKGYGESRPIADNTIKEGRALNRRVELKVLNDFEQ